MGDSPVGQEESSGAGSQNRPVLATDNIKEIPRLNNCPVSAAIALFISQPALSSYCISNQHENCCLPEEKGVELSP